MNFHLLFIRHHLTLTSLFYQIVWDLLSLGLRLAKFSRTPLGQLGHENKSYIISQTWVSRKSMVPLTIPSHLASYKLSQ